MMLDENTPQEGEGLDANIDSSVENSQTTESQSSVGSEIAQRGGEAIKKQGKKIAEKAGKEVAKGAAKSSLLASLSTVLMYVALVLVIIFVIIGLIMFFVTMPGMIMDKLKALFKAMGNYVAAFFGADTTTQIDDVEIYETLDYLEQMGWDIKAEGFLTGFVEEGDLTSDQISQIEEGEDRDWDYDEETGVVRYDDGKVAYAESDFIFTYIMSDNYVYTLKNDNIVTQNPTDDWFKNLLDGVKTAWYKIKNFMYGPLLDALGITDAVGDKWGKGLIAVYYDVGSDPKKTSNAASAEGIGRIDHLVNDDTFWNWDAIEINTDTKKLSIKRRSFLNNNNAMEFSLDGWTGRYGMPVEFLLAVHKATMMPDLAMDMVTTFPTEIALLLHKTSGEAIGAYKNKDDLFLSYERIEADIHLFKSDGFFAKLINAIDDWFTTGGEVQAAATAGVDVGPDYCNDCTTKDASITDDGYLIERKYRFLARDQWVYAQIVYDPNYPNDADKALHKPGDFYKYYSDYQPDSKEIVDKACDKCKAKLAAIHKYLKNNNDYNFEAYAPYISKVSDHWYRDVYFVVNTDSKSHKESYTGNLDFVDYDYNYEALVDERWTLYETYTDDAADSGTYKYNPEKAGEFILFELNDKGEYKKSGGKYVVFDGEFTDARPTILFEKVGNEYKEYTGSRLDISGKNIYRYTSDGKYVKYTGDIAVAKKAVTQNSKDKENFLKDVGWNENSDEVWSAYKLENTQSGYEPLFTQEDIDAKAKTDIEKEVMKACYVDLQLVGNMVQTGEGQRTQTNSKIKQMFLKNNYFRYTGDERIAEIITKLREEVAKKRGSDKSKYGALADSELDIKVSVRNADEKKTETYSVKDVAGKVMLNQDSLNAFSMLENTHTLDADYIYRDFKELIVELGYFTKEEITGASIYKVLQFPVADIGSGGYPDRAIDKNENEFGTAIHSKGDIEANEKNKLVSLYTQAAEDIKNGTAPELEVESGASGGGSSGGGASLIGKPSSNVVATQMSSFSGGTVADIQAIVGSMGTEFERISKPGDGYEYVVKCGSVEFTHYYQFDGSYKDLTFTWSGQTKTISRAGCGPTACVNLLTGYGEDVNPTDTIAGLKFSATLEGVNEFMTKYDVPGKVYTDNEVMVTKIKEAFAEGRPIVTLMSADKNGDTFWTTGGHFVPMIGIDGSGNVITLDSGSRKAERHTYPGGVEGLLNCMTGVWIADVAPSGMEKKGEAYTGYEGNEAVVSPVTGVLLEYGTYEKEIDSVTGEEYRVNVDILYGKDKNKSVADMTKEPEKQEEGATVVDKVGYAKILVLDAESYQKIEAGTNNKWKNNSLVKIVENKVATADKDGNVVESTKQTVIYEGVEGKDKKAGFTSEDIKDWKQIDKTIYGYKEFAELYNATGIAGNVIYIDGFVAEKPDEKLSPKDGATSADEEDISEKLPDGIDLKKSDFAIRESELESLAKKAENKDDTAAKDAKPESIYEEDKAYKMASKKATTTAQTEKSLKGFASPALAIKVGTKDEMIVIKQGTVLGRTMTDKELIEKVRVSSPEPYEAYRPAKDSSTTDDKNEDRVMGNYLRVIFRDEDGTVIENVENYMMLDELYDIAGDQEYKAWEGDLELLAEIMVHESSYSYLSISDRFKNDQTEADFEMYCMGYSVVNKLLKQNEKWYGHLYDETRTDMSPLAQVVTSAWYGPRETMKAYIAGTHKGCYTDKELKYAEYCLKHDCTSITKPSETPLGSVAKADGYSTTPTGSKIPRAMCQQGGYGDGAPGQSKIILVGFWDHDDNGEFGNGDELWGVDRAMEDLID